MEIQSIKIRVAAKYHLQYRSSHLPDHHRFTTFSRTFMKQFSSDCLHDSFLLEFIAGILNKFPVLS